jgi:hypothetical protein
MRAPVHPLLIPAERPWRIFRVLEQHDPLCTLNACAEALALSPWLARDRLARPQDLLPRLSLAEAASHERGRGAALDRQRGATIEEVAGVRPRLALPLPADT